MASPGELPAYLQISEMLIREISAGKYLDGERMAPERDLADEYGVAVGTLRKSLADLALKGMLDRRQGSGNYVRAVSAPESLYAFFRIELKQGGGLPTARVISVEKRKKPVSLPNFGTSSTGYRIRRLRMLNNTPVALEEIWLDGDCADEFTTDQLSDSLYLFYKEQLGVEMDYIEDSVGLGQVPSWSPREFKPSAGNDTGFIERMGWSTKKEAVEFSRTWFDTDLARYVSRMR